MSPEMKNIIDLMNRNYKAVIKSHIDQDKIGLVTLKVSPSELSLIRNLLDDHIEKLHDEWDQAVNEEINPNENPDDYACDLAWIQLKNRRAMNLSDKIARHFREE